MTTTRRRPLADHDARQAIREDLEATMLVEAAAGTGKTTELLARLLNVLAQGLAPIDAIVAVTFTEKAAGELKLRLREELERERTRLAAEVRRGTPGSTRGVAATLQRLEHALAHLEDAHVNTIHGFCADLLRERPVEAHVDPRFEVLAEGQDEATFAEEFDRWLEGALEDPPPGVRRALRRRDAFDQEDTGAGPLGRLRNAAWQLAEWRDFQAPWSRPSFDRDARLDDVAREITRVAALTAAPGSTRDNLYEDTRDLRDFARSLHEADARGGVDLDGREGDIVAFAGDLKGARIRRGRSGDYKPGVPRGQVLAAIDHLGEVLEQFVEDADADLAASLQQELREPLARYERVKAETGRLDFVDLLLRARDLVRDNAEVRSSLQARFARIFVDEFQDTDPIQAEILMLLAADSPDASEWRCATAARGKLFLVGDPKQSIYRFRRADVGTYWEVRDALVASGHARIVRLTTSFRAAPAIQRCVNAAFAPVMTGDRATLQAEYEPLTPFRADRTDQPHVVALPVPAPYGSRNVSGKAIDASLPEAVGAFVDWLIRESGWRVTDRAGRRGGAEERPVRAGDIALLFRRFTSWQTDVTRPYVDALEARGVPHLLVGGKSFADREEITTLVAALSAIEWPDDELAVFATLRGGFFGLDDRTLLAYRQRHGRVHPFRVPEWLEDEGLSGVADALDLLHDLHRRRNRVPVADTIARLLRDTRAHAGLVLRPGGEQALANVLHVIELARRHEEAGGLSFRGFVERLQEGDLAATSEAPILEQGSDGVRLLTVHKAKGLEFPVVILADITCQLARRDASRHLDPARGLCAVRLAGWAPHDLRVHEAEEVERERAEGLRVAYVAATRARDLLVVPAVGDRPFEDRWVSVLNHAVYPPPDRRRAATPGVGCPAFGKDSVCIRPDGIDAGSGTVMPGRHAFDAAEASGLPAGEDAPYSVVWWDPSLLRPAPDASRGLRHTDLIHSDTPQHVVDEGVRRFRAWETSRQEALDRGAVPSIDVQLVTERAKKAPMQPAAESEVPIVQAGVGEGARPEGVRFGRLVHETLAVTPLDARPSTVNEVCAQQARLAGASDEERDAAAALVVRVLADPALAGARAAAAAGRCLRETPVTWRAADGALVEGVVDLAYEDADGWCVIDFKTDAAPSAATLQGYRRQVALYAEAIGAATGLPVRGVIVRV